VLGRGASKINSEGTASLKAVAVEPSEDPEIKITLRILDRKQGFLTKTAQFAKIDIIPCPTNNSLTSPIRNYSAATTSRALC
jgi:hypothetical protein